MNSDDQRALLRQIPQVDLLLRQPAFRQLADAYSDLEVASTLRQTLERLRRRALEQKDLNASDLMPNAIYTDVAAALEEAARPYYRRVINATGVILHTGLGRAPLPSAATEALAASGRAQRVEFDLESGQRGGRDRGCVELIRKLTGCEAATVVNNNAAATVLILSALARNRRVLVSRGELVEIGGSYRIPDILRESGAILTEVGTTNRTHLRDYEQAINDAGDIAGMILKVHTSNYRVIGFTAEVELRELATLGQKYDLPVVHDMGSGCLIDLEARGFPSEPSVQKSLAAGADLVCFSGDKLLGGPQAGIIAGRQELVDRCRQHPLYRALRPGRLIYTALEATLRLYLQGEEAALVEIPALERLTCDRESLRRRARKLHRRLRSASGLHREIVACTSQAGSGSLPARDLNSWGVRVWSDFISTDDLATRLRIGDPAILARVQDDALVFDVRTLADGDLPVLAERLISL